MIDRIYGQLARVWGELRTRMTPLLLAQALVTLVLAGLGWLSLLGGPTYEYSFVAGLIAPLGLLLGASMTGADRRVPLRFAVEDGLRVGLVQLLLLASVAGLHGLRVGFCDAQSQWVYFLLGPGVGCVAAGVCGGLVGWVGSKAPRGGRGLALCLCLGLWGISVGTSLYRYYTSPMIFAFDHFVGFFAGTLYDTVIDGTGRLVSYRVGTLSWLVAVWALSGLLGVVGQAGVQARSRQLVWAGGLGLTAAVGCGVALAGPTLGHWQTEATIREALGGSFQHQRCELIYDLSIPQQQAVAIARDCDAHLTQQERYLEVAAPKQVRVYLFASSQQKAWLMGAAGTNIAKPWRREVYIQQRSFPHPVLGHELAHVMGGQFGQGPFRIAGSWSGWLPDPGRIEGLAVATSPRPDDDLTTRQWAKAMLSLELLPPLRAVFQLGFLKHNARMAYTVAGAFMGWLHQEYGAGALRAWYAGTPLKSVAGGKSLEQLEEAFRASLGEVDVPPKGMAAAKHRFERVPLFARRCPHQVDALNARAGMALGQGAALRAATLYRKMLELDPGSVAAKMGLGRCRWRGGDGPASAGYFDQLARDGRLTQVVRAAALEESGKARLALGDWALAQSNFEQAEEIWVNEHRLRNLEVLSSISTQKAGQSALLALLVGRPGQAPDGRSAQELLVRWDEQERDSGLASYLLARGHYAQGRWDGAARNLQSAISRRLPPRVRSEALRLGVFVHCARGDRLAAQASVDQYLRGGDAAQARREGVRRFAQRCGLAPRTE